MDTISTLLAESVVASTAKNSERQLKLLESQEGFPLTLLHIVASTNLPGSTRLAGALFFKNFIKRKWVDENGEYLISISDAELVKKEIITLMIQLPNNLQIQVGEAISIIADSDFPHRWSDLLDELISKLSTQDMITNKGVLTVAHSIFKRWRPLFRSDALFLEIKLVLDKFAVPFLNLLQSVDLQISQNNDCKVRLEPLFEVLLILIKIYYDLNCQDIPEFFEDNIKIGMNIMHKYLSYENSLLEENDEDDEISILSKVKSSIEELVQLYTSRYEDVFGPMVNDFIHETWNLLVSMTNQPKNDILVSKCLSFMTAVARIPRYFVLFDNESALNDITEKIILPNVTLRESDEELFEDDPIEYVRRDLEGSDSDTRRRACTDFLKELKEKNETLVTNVVLVHINKFFEQYKTNTSGNWKFKDLCVYLFTSLAINGNITSLGVSSTNQMLNVVDFFTKEISQDLINPVSHPILRVDAIKYIYTFRNQLNKQQLIEILPVMTKFLQDNNYVVYTYASITIERILASRESLTSTSPVFKKADLINISRPLLINLFSLVLKQGSTPEKLSENEFLMKSIYRVLITSEDLINSYISEILSQLLNLVSIIAKNPSNPRFTHYNFESICTLIKYNHSNLDDIINTTMPVFLTILREDIQEFSPYVFQIVAYYLEILPSGSPIPDNIKQLSDPLLSANIWEVKGNIPAITRLLKNIIKVDFTIYSNLTPVLGIFQRLIASKSYDTQGFELLECLMLYIPLDTLQPYLKQIAVLLLQRLQNSRTEKYVKKFLVFLGTLSYKLGSDVTIQFIDEVQEGLFEQIWVNFVINTLPNIGNLLDRKIALVGALNMITNGVIFSNKYSNLVVPTLSCILTTTVSKSIVNIKSDFDDSEMSEDIFIFGSSFSKLVSISDKPYDPMPHVDLTQGVPTYVAKELIRYNESTSKTFLANVIPQLSDESKQALALIGIN